MDGLKPIKKEKHEELVNKSLASKSHHHDSKMGLTRDVIFQDSFGPLLIVLCKCHITLQQVKQENQTKTNQTAHQLALPFLTCKQVSVRAAAHVDVRSSTCSNSFIYILYEDYTKIEKSLLQMNDDFF